jgi:Tat protein translocase TatC
VALPRCPSLCRLRLTPPRAVCVCCGQAAGYSGLLLGSPVILYEIVAFVLPGLTRSERRFLAPIVLGSSVLFYAGLAFSYNILVPAALNFFVTYAENVVESIWSIDQYFEFVLVLLFSTGLAFQVSPCSHHLVVSPALCDSPWDVRPFPPRLEAWMLLLGTLLLHR